MLSLTEKLQTIKDKVGNINNIARQYKSLDEMNADNNIEEGQLGIVYNQQILNSNLDTIFKKIYFPKTVVLPEPMTDYCSLSLRCEDSGMWMDCYCMLDSNNFNCDIMRKRLL